MISEGQYSLRELVRETGFSVRQIRFYISQKLVPGAGSDRGPNTRYSQETLDRLKLIDRLKREPVGPANRTRTLEEIRLELDGMGRDQIRLQAAGAPWAAPLESRMPLLCSFSRTDPSPVSRLQPRGELHHLLSQVLRLVEDLSQRKPHSRPPSEDTWRRVTTDLVEVQVKLPGDEDERRRLGEMVSSLKELLGPDWR